MIKEYQAGKIELMINEDAGVVGNEFHFAATRKNFLFAISRAFRSLALQISIIFISIPLRILENEERLWETSKCVNPSHTREIKLKS